MPTATRSVFCSAAASGNYNACTYVYLKKKHIHMERCRIPLQDTKSVLSMLIRTKRHVYINHLFQCSAQSTMAATVHVSTRRDIKILSSTEFAYRKSGSVKSKYVLIVHVTPAFDLIKHAYAFKASKGLTLSLDLTRLKKKVDIQNGKH